jgi:hypothetical protein
VGSSFFIRNMGLCSRPGEDPNDWKQFGPETTWASSVPVWVGRLGGDGFWVRDYDYGGGSE